MPAGASPKREREYRKLKTEFRREGRYPGREEEVAARIVNAQRAERGETKASASATATKRQAPSTKRAATATRSASPGTSKSSASGTRRASTGARPAGTGRPARTSSTARGRTSPR